MELGAKLHVPAPVSLGERPLYPLLRRSGGPQSRPKAVVRKETSAPAENGTHAINPCLVTIDKVLLGLSLEGQWDTTKTSVCIAGVRNENRTGRLPNKIQYR
jgi:hypothetical protein